jgi:hypothetical protein
VPRRRLPTPVPEIEDGDHNVRDFVMARLMAARASAQAVIEAIDVAASAFVNPESDAKGRERREVIEDALEAAGTVSRALESAEAELEVFDADDWKEREPWEDEDGEEDDDEEEDEDDDDH